MKADTRPPNCAYCQETAERERQERLARLDAMYAEIESRVFEVEYITERIQAIGVRDADS